MALPPDSPMLLLVSSKCPSALYSSQAPLRFPLRLPLQSCFSKEIKLLAFRVWIHQCTSNLLNPHVSNIIIAEINLFTSILDLFEPICPKWHDITDLIEPIR